MSLKKSKSENPAFNNLGSANVASPVIFNVKPKLDYDI